MVTSNEDEPARGRARVLGVISAASMIFAYVSAFVVLDDPAMASKFENGELPPNTDVAGDRIAVVTGIVAALVALITAVMANKAGATVFTKTVAVLVFLAFVPFALVTILLNAQLAF